MRLFQSIFGSTSPLFSSKAKDSPFLPFLVGLEKLFSFPLQFEQFLPRYWSGAFNFQLHLLTVLLTTAQFQIQWSYIIIRLCTCLVNCSCHTGTVTNSRPNEQQKPGEAKSNILFNCTFLSFVILNFIQCLLEHSNSHRLTKCTFQVVMSHWIQT